MSQRTITIVLALLGLWMASPAVPVQLDFRRSLPVYDGTVTLPGLQRPVIVERDAFAVPHIRAENLHDLFLAQGYITAQDRLWQLDLQRRIASGRLAEIFGSVSLPSDRFYRQLGLRRNLRKRLAALSEPTRALLQAYADGVNAFIREHRTRMPPEFAVLNYVPEFWSIEDSLLLLQLGAWSLSTSYPIDLLRQQAAARLSAERVAELFPTATSQDVISFITPPGWRSKRRRSSSTNRDASSVAPWGMFPPLPSLSRPPSAATRVAGMTAEDGVPWFAGLNGHAGWWGLSNNWVVAGRRTASGEALLSNDTHLLVTIPALMTIVHLSAPELEVEGIALPGVPGIIAGRNAHIAWGVTNLPADVQDLFQVRFKSFTSHEYMLDGEWVPAEVVEETIRIRSGSRFTTEPLTVLITRFGPVLERRGATGLAIAWSMFDVLAEEWESFFALNRATNWDEFVAALAAYPGPCQVVLYADDEGHIGLQAAGRIPVRGVGDGTVPIVAESQRVAWQGWIPFEALPRRFDPPTGWLVAANQRLVDEAYPYLITKNWGAPFRARRIATLLQQSSKLTLDDMRRIQADVWSWPDHLLAEQIVAAAGRLGGLSDEEAELLSQLRAWDGTIAADSYWPTIMDLVRRELWTRLLAGRLGQAWTSNYMTTAFDAAEMFLVNVLQQRPRHWLPDDVTSYDGLLLAAWRQAIAQARARFGQLDRALWGDYAALFFHHAFGPTSAFSRLFDRGPIRLSGNGLTVNFHHQSLAVGMRLLVDFSQASFTWACIPTGISGHPLSPHYDDQIERWKDVHPLQLPFAAVPPSSDIIHRLVLQPDEAASRRWSTLGAKPNGHAVTLDHKFRSSPEASG